MRRVWFTVAARARAAATCHSSRALGERAGGPYPVRLHVHFIEYTVSDLSRRLSLLERPTQGTGRSPYLLQHETQRQRRSEALQRRRTADDSTIVADVVCVDGGRLADNISATTNEMIRYLPAAAASAAAAAATSTAAHHLPTSSTTTWRHQRGGHGPSSAPPAPISPALIGRRFASSPIQIDSSIGDAKFELAQMTIVPQSCHQRH